MHHNSRITSPICMKLMQDIFDDTLRSYNNIWQIDNIIIIIYLGFINYEIYQNPLKIEVFFGDVISGQDNVTDLQFSMEVKILGRSFSKKNFWVDWTNQLLAEFMTRYPTFQISTSEKTHISRKYPPTKPRFPLSRQRWIRW